MQWRPSTTQQLVVENKNNQLRKGKQMTKQHVIPSAVRCHRLGRNTWFATVFSIGSVLSAGLLLAQSVQAQAPQIKCPDDEIEVVPVPQSAVVTFPDARILNGVTATVTCTPASGSTFPFGETMVTCTAVNASGADSCSFQVKVVLPRQAKVAVRDELNGELLRAQNPQVADLLKRAIAALNNSLNAVLWIDDSHPAIKDGDKVFSFEAEAAKQMLSAATLAQRNDIRDLALVLAQADRVMAQLAIAEAIARGANQNAINNAMAAFNKADQELAAGAIANAMKDFGVAWKAAVQALP
jgi:hypothetical protein